MIVISLICAESVGWSKPRLEYLHRPTKGRLRRCATVSRHVSRRSVGSFDAGSHLVAELGATIASGAAGGPGCWFAGDGTIASNCAARWGAVQKNGGRGATWSA